MNTTMLMDILNQYNGERDVDPVDKSQILIFPKEIKDPVVLALAACGYRLVVSLKPSTHKMLFKVLSEIDSGQVVSPEELKEMGIGDEVLTDEAKRLLEALTHAPANAMAAARRGLIRKWNLKVSDHKVALDTEADVSPVWERICDLLRRDGYATWWKFGDHIYDTKAADAIATNPQRRDWIDPVDVQIEINELEKLMQEPVKR